jgi:hypothetical protein
MPVSVDAALGKSQIQRAGKALWIAGLLQIGIFAALVAGAAVSFGTFTTPMGQVLQVPTGSSELPTPPAFQNFHDMSQGSAQRGSNKIPIVVVAMIMLGCLLVFAHSLAMTMEGKALMRLRPMGWRLAAAAALFPLAPGRYLSMPVGVYLLAIFRQIVDCKTGAMEDLLDGCPPSG